MRRRDFIALLGGATAAWPLTARSQQAGKLRTIGYLASDPSVFSPWTSAFLGRLGELGWVEGRTVAIEYRFSEGRAERVTEVAAEFVQKKVDVILTSGSAVPAFKRATATIPIVFAAAFDPIGSGLVTSLSRPGGNVTGLSVQAADIASKRLELLHEIVPSLRHLTIVFEASNPQALLEKGAVEAAARKFDLETAPHEIRRAEDIAPIFDPDKSRADAVYVVETSLVVANRAQITALALKARLPTTFNFGASAKAGALMSYGPDMAALFRRSADIVDKILRGANPGEIPVEQPTKFGFVINLKTAKALGLAVPDKMLALADEVIE